MNQVWLKMTICQLFQSPIIHPSLCQYLTRQYLLLCQFMAFWLPILHKDMAFILFSLKFQPIWVRFFTLILKRYVFLYYVYVKEDMSIKGRSRCKIWILSSSRMLFYQLFHTSACGFVLFLVVILLITLEPKVFGLPPKLARLWI